MTWQNSMTRQNSHRMSKSMEEIMYSWDIAKEHRVQDKSDCAYHDNSLLRQRDIMFPKEMYLSLNVFELLDGCHRLSLYLTLGIYQAKKPDSICNRIGFACSHLYPPTIARCEGGFVALRIRSPGSRVPYSLAFLWSPTVACGAFVPGTVAGTAALWHFPFPKRAVDK